MTFTEWARLQAWLFKHGLEQAGYEVKERTK